MKKIYILFFCLLFMFSFASSVFASQTLPTNIPHGYFAWTQSGTYTDKILEYDSLPTGVSLIVVNDGTNLLVSRSDGIVFNNVSVGTFGYPTANTWGFTSLAPIASCTLPLNVSPSIWSSNSNVSWSNGTAIYPPPPVHMGLLAQWVHDNLKGIDVMSDQTIIDLNKIDSDGAVGFGNHFVSLEAGVGDYSVIFTPDYPSLLTYPTSMYAFWDDQSLTFNATSTTVPLTSPGSLYVPDTYYSANIRSIHDYPFTSNGLINPSIVFTQPSQPSNTTSDTSEDYTVKFQVPASIVTGEPEAGFEIYVNGTALMTSSSVISKDVVQSLDASNNPWYSGTVTFNEPLIVGDNPFGVVLANETAQANVDTTRITGDSNPVIYPPIDNSGGVPPASTFVPPTDYTVPIIPTKPQSLATLDDISSELHAILVFIEAPFSYISDIVSSITGWMNESMGWITQITRFLGAIFSYLPPDLIKGIEVIFSITVFFSVLRIWRR